MTYSDNQPEAELVGKHTTDQNDSPDSDGNVKAQEKKWTGQLRRWAITLGVFYLVIILFLLLAEPYLVYPALLSDDSQTREIPALPNGFVEKISVQTEDEILIDTFHYCPAESVQNSRGVLLFCHGNGEWIDRMVPFLISLGQSLDVSVVCFDYRGYGQSQGFPFEKGILKDTDSVYQTVKKLGYSSDRIIVFGRSIGGGPSCYLASKEQIGGLILHNTFSSLVDVAASKFFWLPIRMIMRNRYDSESRLKNYQGPLLQSHGTKDRIVPFRFGKQLFDSAGTDSADKEFLVQENTGHNDPMSNEFRNKIRQMLDRVLGPRPTR